MYSIAQDLLLCLVLPTVRHEIVVDDTFRTNILFVDVHIGTRLDCDLKLTMAIGIVNNSEFLNALAELNVLNRRTNVFHVLVDVELEDFHHLVRVVGDSPTEVFVTKAFHHKSEILNCHFGFHCVNVLCSVFTWLFLYRAG